ncbi:protein involved in gliding motility GldD [Pseudopedobacter saltans DSM 12145]|uniref:Protein involved in gliding motility GldD n=1 Tax=Pseudopedobacter saltans (strain ATCC 51119 / DSM 12145 / JCM 21818 / CCUG 39354 / LMG 10337 / NBRC 100064 / NCIMB 13643) TaxID=762903 RepID=F0S9L9_PSESL|nr:gliding motility lipoprotein GldD [Pseudopedobacter saltans]ADY53572.1 protein involved in gliding motility GldD [Pseudopedobacter saltans DSM 12145]
MKFGIYIICVFLGLVSCSDNGNYAPKPRGYFRIDFPEKSYREFSSDAPYTFEYPVYAEMYPDSSKDSRKNWYNLAFPGFNARLHISYYSFNNEKELEELTEDSRKLAFKHTVKATGIDEALIKNKEKKVYGVYYTIEGNTASLLQFYLTDSIKNYLRGALYFNEKPKFDSIQPVETFIRKDLDKMISTFKWK